MKYIISVISLVVLLLTFTGCKKEGLSASASLEGSWELRQAQTGMIPTIIYAPGNGNILKLHSNKYQYYYNSQLVESGSYAVAGTTDTGQGVCLELNANQYTNSIIFDGDLNKSKRFQITGNTTLSFLSGCFALDSGAYLLYEKQ